MRVTYYSQSEKITQQDAEELAGAGVPVGIKYNGWVSCVSESAGTHNAWLTTPLYRQARYLGHTINRGAEIVRDAEAEVQRRFGDTRRGPD